MRQRHPGLRIVLEHITTEQAVDYVASGDQRLAATITPHHLHLNRNAMFVGGLKSDFYCLPVVKRECHRRALVKAATSGLPCFFLGTDSAPHPRAGKESACGCAGICNAMHAMESYAAVFDALAHQGSGVVGYSWSPDGIQWDGRCAQLVSLWPEGRAPGWMSGGNGATRTPQGIVELGGANREVLLSFSGYDAVLPDGAGRHESLGIARLQFYTNSSLLL